MKRRNASISEPGSGLPESWEIGIATRLVKDAQLKWDCLRNQEEGDLVQEVLEHWYRKKHKYDPKRGASLKTFMAAVVRNKIGGIVEFRMAQKRKDEAYTVSLDEPVGDNDESRTLAEETTEDGAPKPLHDYASGLDRGLDVSKALQKLTGRQQRICSLLSEKNVTMTEVAQVLGIHRSTLYEELARIRGLFKREGLRVYLRNNPTL